MRAALLSPLVLFGCMNVCGSVTNINREVSLDVFPRGYINVTEPPCSLDNTGVVDVTTALQACINLAYNYSVPVVPLFFPGGTYLVSDTITIEQNNPGGDDGINVVPGRFLPRVLVGATASGMGNRPVIVLAANSPGFGNTDSKYKPVIDIFEDPAQCGEGCDMNNLFKGIDIDLTRPGNPGAVGIVNAGAQGATVTDVTVRAAPTTFACYAGVNGAGGSHANIACYGAKYGLYIDNSQPVPVVVGATLVNQSISAVYYFSQETLSMVGVNIITSPTAAGPVITVTSPSTLGMTFVDVNITCTGANLTAISTKMSLHLRDVYVSGCGVSVDQANAPSIPGPGSACPGQAGAVTHISLYAKGNDPMPYYHSDVVYINGSRQDGGLVSTVDQCSSAGVPSDLITRHLWDEASFPWVDAPGTANAVTDCGAVGDGVTDDTAALQSCLSTHTSVFLPPGLFRISATLDLQPGGALVGMGNGASYILASSDGFPGANASNPTPMVRTAANDAAAAPTILAFLGIVTWQHLPDVYTLNWRSQNPSSVWRVNFESRDCECLWLSAYQQLSPTIVPCKLPVNITMPKSVFRGVGRVYSFVNDDTGAIISTGAKYRSLMIRDIPSSSGITSASSRLRFYSLNLEHAQSEANAEITNASWVDIYSVKSEGNLPALWIRSSTDHVAVLGLGGGLTAFAYNFTFPSDFELATPCFFRVDPGAQDITFASLLDHGYGAAPPYWPPNNGGCRWKHEYPYPGSSVDAYPFWTYPNVTMWNCWYGYRAATAYWYMIGIGATGTGTTPMDKPVYYTYGAS